MAPQENLYRYINKHLSFSFIRIPLYSSMQIRIVITFSFQVSHLSLSEEKCCVHVLKIFVDFIHLDPDPGGNMKSDPDPGGNMKSDPDPGGNMKSDPDCFHGK